MSVFVGLMSGTSLDGISAAVVRFRTGVHKIANLQVARHLVGQRLGVLRHVRLQVNRGRVLERGILLVRRGNDVRMAVADADGHDATEAVEVAFPGVVPDILHAALDDHDRLLVVEEEAGVEVLLAQREHLLRGRRGKQMHQSSDNAGPPGLMTGAKARSVVAVEVLVEQQQIPPVRVVLEGFGAPVDGPASLRISQEDAGQPLGEILGDFVQRQAAP